LSYVNLQGEGKRKNSVGQAIRKELWIPNLAFENCVKDFFVVMDELASLTVYKRTNATSSLSDKLQEEERFDGEFNDLVYLRNYILLFQCDLYLQKYPFDTQTFLITVKIDFSFTVVCKVSSRISVNTWSRWEISCMFEHLSIFSVYIFVDNIFQ
jgi:hypothetical protein